LSINSHVAALLLETSAKNLSQHFSTGTETNLVCTALSFQFITHYRINCTTYFSLSCSRYRDKYKII